MTFDLADACPPRLAGELFALSAPPVSTRRGLLPVSEEGLSPLELVRLPEQERDRGTPFPSKLTYPPFAEAKK